MPISLTRTLSAAALSLGLVAGAAHAADDTIKVGTMAGPETDVMQVAKQVAKEKYGLDVEIIEFTDYVTPNAALADGSAVENGGGPDTPFYVRLMVVDKPGVLADITPPVARAAYAGATIAQSDLMKTGNTAFKLGAAKALVPFVFIYAPSMLFVIDGFSWEQFLIATIGCAIGVVMIGAALTGYLLHPMAGWHRLLMGFGALFVIAPGIESGVIGLAIASPVLLLQFFGWRRRNASLAGSETVDSTEPWD